MVELAVFGTFVLIGLAFIVRSGMSFFNAQRASQYAFRAALKAAYETRAYGDPRFDEVTIKEQPECPRCLPKADPSMPGCPVDPDCTFSPLNQGQVLLVRDVFAADDPTNAFATGTPNPTVASASVVWGTDGAEFEPNDIEDSTDLPTFITRVNDKEFKLRSGRFRTEEHPFTPALAELLCQYDDVYGSISVDFFDAAGVNLNKDGDDDQVIVNFDTCTAGRALILTNGEHPVRVVVKIVDACLGDFLNPKECKSQCAKAGRLGLPVPAYCGNLPSDTSPQGLDLGNFTRTHTIDNKLQRIESGQAVQAHTTIQETAVVDRKIWTNPNVTPDFPLKTGDDGSPYIDATTSVSRQRDHQWNTRW